MDPVVIPLFDIEAVDWKAPEAGGFDGLLLTSANAVRCAGEQLKDLRGLRVYAVGPATAEAARDAGFDVASAGDAGVERLLGSIEPDLRLLHLAGEDRKAPEHAGQQITAVTVYRSRARDADVRAAVGGVALVHSPRAGRRFAELVGGERGAIAIAAISSDAADAVGTGWAAVEAAEAPTDEALLALTERLCNNIPAT
jgi:uroporphyrinogen-III synthase